MAHSRNRVNYHGPTEVTAPSVEPVTLAEVKAQMRITSSDEDTYIGTLIQAAREYTELYLSRALVAQTWDIWFDSFPCGFEPIVLPSPPLISVTWVKYTDTNGDEQTFSASSYTVDTTAPKGLIYPNYDAQWPSARDFHKTVTVRYIAGYADSGASPVDLADNIPAPIKAAIKMLIAHWYENRETTAPAISVNEIPHGYHSILAPYKMQAF